MPDRIITRVASAMIAVAILAGCSSHKTATADRAVLMADTHTATATTAGTQSYDNREMFRLLAEGLVLRFSADSLAAPSGTIYRPELEVEVNKPTIAGAKTETGTKADTAGLSFSDALRTDLHSAETSVSDTVGAAEPIDGEERSKYFRIIAMALIVLWLVRYILDR